MPVPATPSFPVITACTWYAPGARGVSCALVPEEVKIGAWPTEGAEATGQTVMNDVTLNRVGQPASGFGAFAVRVWTMKPLASGTVDGVTVTTGTRAPQSSEVRAAAEKNF